MVTRNVYVVKGANMRHAQLALSDDLVARHCSLSTAPDDYRDAVRKLFTSHLGSPAACIRLRPVCVHGVRPAS